MHAEGNFYQLLSKLHSFLLQAAKMANYAKFQKMCDLLFVMFAMVFITTRLGIFPVW